MGPVSFLTVTDLSPFTSATADQLAIIIEDLEAVAAQAAPCLTEPGMLTPGQVAATVAILRSAALRWADRTQGGDRQLQAGPFTYGAITGQTAESRRPLLWPSEITALQGVCAGVRRRAVLGWLA